MRGSKSGDEDTVTPEWLDEIGLTGPFHQKAVFECCDKNQTHSISALKTQFTTSESERLQKKLGLVAYNRLGTALSSYEYGDSPNN